MDSPMGGYGLYYATVMQSVGLVALADRRLGLAVDAVTPGRASRRRCVPVGGG